MSDRSSGLRLDVERLRPIIQAPLPPLDLAELVLPRGRGGPGEAVRRHVARIYLKRFLVACGRAHAVLPEGQLRRCLGHAVAAFQRLDEERMLAAMRRPELTSLTWRLLGALETGAPGMLEESVMHLGRLLMPVLLPVLAPGEPLLVVPSGPRTLHLLALGRTLISASPLPPAMEVERRGDSLALLLSPRRMRCVPMAALAGDASALLDDGLRLAHLPVIDDGPILLRRDHWFEAVYPQDGSNRSSPPWWEIDARSFSRFSRRISQASALLARHWSEAWEEFRETVSVLISLRPAGLTPHNESMNAFRGLVAIAARSPALAAQSLSHERGHNQFSNILETFRLYENPERQAYSPFVETRRPLDAVFHGIFSFLQDVHLTRRMIGRVPDVPGAPMARYLEELLGRIEAALRIVRREAHLTQQGARLVHGFEQALQ